MPNALHKVGGKVDLTVLPEGDLIIRALQSIGLTLKDIKIRGVAELRDDSCGVGILPARKYKGRARCPSHKNSKIIPQICNAKSEVFPQSKYGLLSSKVKFQFG